MTNLQSFGTIEPLILDFGELNTLDKVNPDLETSKNTATKEPEATKVPEVSKDQNSKELSSKETLPTKDNLEPDKNLQFNPEELGKDPIDLDFKTEEDTVEELPNSVKFYADTINALYDNVFDGQMQPYEGYNDEEEPSAEMLEKLVKHNLELAKEQAEMDFVNSLSDSVKRIIEMDLNANNEKEVLDYIKTLVAEDNTKSLDVNNEFHQEKIVSQWYKNEGWSEEEIEEKISDLKNAGLLQKEASRVKPKLDAKAEEVTRKKEEAQRKALEMEHTVRQNYLNKLGQTLSGKISNVSLSKEEASKVFTLLDPQKKNFVINGEETPMSLMDRFLLDFRYNPKADMESLALAAYVLVDKEGFLKKMGKVAATEETRKFVNEHKYGSSKLSGAIKEDTKDLKKDPKQTSWKLKI